MNIDTKILQSLITRLSDEVDNASPVFKLFYTKNSSEKPRLRCFTSLYHLDMFLQAQCNCQVSLMHQTPDYAFQCKLNLPQLL